MKKSIFICGALALLAMTSCNQTNTENTQAPAEKTAPPRDSTLPDGTTIKVNEQGMSVESKEGSKKTNVSVSKDSASIEISNPK